VGAPTQKWGGATRLITGEGNRSAIGTLVERSTRYVMLLHLPIDHTAEAVRDASPRQCSRYRRTCGVR